MDDNINIGQRIAQLREQNKIPRSALAKKSGVALSFLNSIEKGAKDVTTRTLQKICCGLGITMVFLASKKYTKRQPKYT